jgi:hypothetical protein
MHLALGMSTLYRNIVHWGMNPELVGYGCEMNIKYPDLCVVLKP